MIYIASDHDGFTVKEELEKYLSDDLHYAFVDDGPEVLIPDDDYPDYANKVCDQILHDDDIGILICDTGIGMSIAANRRKNIRAALCSSIFDAMRSREHNHANVLVLGARTVEFDTLQAILKVFLTTPYSDEERHVRRVGKLN